MRNFLQRYLIRNIPFEILKSSSSWSFLLTLRHTGFTPNSLLFETDFTILNSFSKQSTKIDNTRQHIGFIFVDFWVTSMTKGGGGGKCKIKIWIKSVKSLLTKNRF